MQITQLTLQCRPLVLFQVARCKLQVPRELPNGSSLQLSTFNLQRRAKVFNFGCGSAAPSPSVVSLVSLMEI